MIAKEKVNERILFVGAHPDDSEGFAGTAFLLSRAYDIDIVDLTRGERGLGPEGLADGSTARIRTAEEERACARLGATPVFLGEVNGDCHASAAATECLVAHLCTTRPCAVFTHWPVDRHADHVQCAAVVLAALDRLARTEGWAPELYFYEVLEEQTCQFPVLYAVDISRTLDDKVALLREYACQNPDDELVRQKVDQAAFRGRMCHPPAAFAEVFATLDGRRIVDGVLERLTETTINSSGIITERK